jgi:hypothetical protein
MRVNMTLTCVLTTRPNVITTLTKVISTHTSDFYTQSVILTRTNVITTASRVFSIRTKLISTCRGCRVRLPHGECDFDTNKIGFYT